MYIADMHCDSIMILWLERRNGGKVLNNLRSGERWEQSLEREILNRDMLYLCWSSNARKAKWVEAEWRLALEKKGEDFIEPLPLEGPDICPPPEELARKHFNDRLLYIINRN